MEGRMIALESLGVLLYIGPNLVRRSPLPFPHPKEGNHRVVKALHFFLKLFAQGIALFPIPSLNGIHILRCGIVKVHRKVLLLRLLADFGQYLRLFLGAVCLAGLFILIPEVCEYVSVVIHCKNRKQAGQRQQSGYQKFSHISNPFKMDKNNFRAI